MSKRKKNSGNKAGKQTPDFEPNLSADGIQLLDVTDSKPKRYRQHCRRVEKLLDFRVHQGVVFNEVGDAVYAVSYWDGTFTARSGRLSARYMRLRVMFAGQRYTYAVPIGLVDEKKPLPGLAFSAKELSLVYDMANTLIRAKDKVEEFVNLRDRETSRVKLNRSTSQELNENETLCIASLAPLFDAIPWAFRTFVAAFLANLRPFMSGDAPSYIINFVAPLGSGQATRQALLELLSSCNLTAHPFAQELVVLQAGTVRERHAWEQGGSQLMLMDANDSDWDALLRKAERVPLDITCYREPERFAAQPLVFGRSMKPGHAVDNISLPKTPTPWEDAHLDTLRYAMGKLLDKPKRTARELAHAVQVRKMSAIGYRITTIQAWQDAALDVIKARLPELIDAFDIVQAQMNEQTQALEQRLNSAVELLTHPARYGHFIDDLWPATKDEVIDLLEADDGPVALRRTINRKKFLCFRHDSLLRLAQQVGIDESTYELLIARLLDNALLYERDKTVKFAQGQSLRMVRLPVESCVGNVVTVVTDDEEGMVDEHTK